MGCAVKAGTAWSATGQIISMSLGTLTDDAKQHNFVINMVY